MLLILLSGFKLNAHNFYLMALGLIAVFLFIKVISLHFKIEDLEHKLGLNERKMKGITDNVNSLLNSQTEKDEPTTVKNAEKTPAPQEKTESPPVPDDTQIAVTLETEQDTSKKAPEPEEIEEKPAEPSLTAPAAATIAKAASTTISHTTLNQEETHIHDPDLGDENTTSSAAPSATQSKVGKFFRDFFAGRNTAVILGVAILFLGLVFLFKYAIKHSMLPIEMRLILACLLACILLFVGWLLRKKRESYALILQGGGSGILYLTIFVAFRLYHLVPAKFAFALLFCVMLFSMFLAVMQNSRSLALLSATGGFLAPLLTSTGSNNYVALFSYYSVINAGILGVALYRSWRLLNLTGFFFTFGVGAVWGGLKYKPEYLISCEIFLILFFLMYAVISILFAIKQPPNLRGVVDGTLVFALPLTFISMQIYLVNQYKYGIAFTSLGLGVFYVGITAILLRKAKPGLKTLLEAFLSLGIIFASLAVPMAFDAPYSSAFWAFEGAGLVWIGIRQNRLFARFFGFLLQIGSWYFFLESAMYKKATHFLNPTFMGLMILIVASLFTGYIFVRNKDKVSHYEHSWSRGFTVAGLIWWVWVVVYQLNYLLPSRYFANGLNFMLALSVLAFYLIGKLIKWEDLKYPVFLYFPFLVLLFLAQWGFSSGHLFKNFGFLSWPLALFTLYLTLWIHSRQEDALPSWSVSILHYGSSALVVFLMSIEFNWYVRKWLGGATIWSGIVVTLVPMLFLFLFSQKKILEKRFFAKYEKVYSYSLPLTFAVFLGIVFFLANSTSNGNPSPLPYVFLLNPLDIISLSIVVVIIKWMRRLNRESVPHLGFLVPALLLFFWFNMAIARNIHFWGKVPWYWNDMYKSFMTQMIYSIVWSLLGLSLMVIGNKVSRKIVWIMGGVLMIFVILKLFFIDLSGKDTLFRILSFVVVGIILLVIGYFAPVPHADKDGKSKEGGNEKGKEASST